MRALKLYIPDAIKLPKKDMEGLYQAGLKAIFTPGATLDSLVEWINNNVTPKG